MSLSWFAAAVAGLTLVLMTMGGIVHNTRSSLICPDWPGCNGELLPPVSNTSVVLEHYTHRMVGMTIGILSIVLAIGLYRRARKDGDHGLTWLGVFGVIAVSVVGALGRHTVLGRLVPWASTAKLALATAVYGLFVYIAFRARPAMARVATPRVARATAIAAAFVYVQMIVGAAMRHWGAGLVCMDMPLCKGGLFPAEANGYVWLHQAHRLFGLVVFGVVCWAARIGFRELTGRARLLAAAAPVLVLGQIGLGVASVLTFLDVVPVTLHLDVAVAIFTIFIALHLVARGEIRGAQVNVRAILELAKPRITAMVLVTTAGGMFLAPVALPRMTAVLALLGVTLIVAGANALNMYLERDVDAKMTRTESRPLPTGRLAPRTALIFGVVTGLSATLVLTFLVNPLTGLLAAISFVMYVLWYTPLKQHSTTALLVGAVPGAMPPLLGWTAATGHLQPAGIVLFLILYLWQLPHFIAISMFSAADYTRAGIKVIPVEHGLTNAKHRITLYTLLLVLASLQMTRVMPIGVGYVFAAIVLGAIFIGLALQGLSPRADNRWARRLFRYSLVYLPVLFAAMLIGKP